MEKKTRKLLLEVFIAILISDVIVLFIPPLRPEEITMQTIFYIIVLTTLEMIIPFTIYAATCNWLTRLVCKKFPFAQKHVFAASITVYAIAMAVVCLAMILFDIYEHGMGRIIYSIKELLFFIIFSLVISLFFTGFNTKNLNAYTTRFNGRR